MCVQGKLQGSITKDSRVLVFQYKLLSNVLYLNKMLFKFGKIDSPLCSFYKMIDKSSLHLFYKYKNKTSLGLIKITYL